MSKQFLAQFNKILSQNCYRHHTLDVFRDFCRMSVVSLASPFYGNRFENEYENITQRYSKEEMKRFPEMLSILIQALEDSPHDFLGEVFMSNDMGSSYRGQFFTPQHICDFMAKITLFDITEALKHKEYVSVNEPASGAGAMIISVVKEFIELGLNHSRQLYVVAQDVDPICADMAYLQLSLLGVPAHVILGNTLAMTQERVLATPVYFLENWNERLTQKSKSDIEGALPKKQETQKSEHKRNANQKILSLFDEALLPAV